LPEDLIASNLPEELVTSYLPENLIASHLPEELVTSHLPEELVTSHLPNEVIVSQHNLHPYLEPQVNLNEPVKGTQESPHLAFSSSEYSWDHLNKSDPFPIWPLACRYLAQN